jgi:hypothetical protein
MFGALKYSLLFLLYFTPVRSRDSYDYNSDDCSNALWGGCPLSAYPHLTQLSAATMQNREDLEATVKYVAQVNVRDVCRDLVNSVKCRQDKIASATQQCRDQHSYVAERNARDLEITNYVCVEQLTNLVTHQKCFADYDLITDIGCCGYKIFFSSDCSEQKMLTCAQQKIRSSRKCRSSAVQFFTDVALKMKTTFVGNRDVCPSRPGRTRQPLEFYKQFF